MSIKTVFIFGAGASKADGLPTQAELLKKYFESNPSDDYSGLLKEYFEKFFGISDTRFSGVKWPTFEEALAMVEIALDKEQSFVPNYNAEKLKKIRDGLIISMGRAIENCQISTDTFHNKFINKLFWKGRGRRHYHKQEYSFVSFNYDILLDKALMELIADGIYCDYGVDFINTNARFSSGTFHKWTRPGNKRVLVLKAHGSLNWMQCPSCDALAISGDSKGQIFKTGLIHTIEHCPKDNSQMQFIVEPPSYFKKYKNYYLQLIWKRFAEVLGDADRIIFIGYSMPDADVMVKYTIKRACIEGRKQFVVVNPRMNADEYSALKNRYERVLGTVDFHELGFSELCESENYKKIIRPI